MTYDEKCYELAKSFVDDSAVPDNEKEAITKELAQDIQDEIEGTLSYHETKKRG
jgi:hypothetical protein